MSGPSRAKVSTAGIVEDAVSQQRVIPESRRADGSVRKERKVRPGFTPVEDVARFRSSRQLQGEEVQRKTGIASSADSTTTTAAVAAASSTEASTKVSDNVTASMSQQTSPVKRSWAGSRLRTKATLPPPTTVPKSHDEADEKILPVDGDRTSEKAGRSSLQEHTTVDLVTQMNKLGLSSEAESRNLSS